MKTLTMKFGGTSVGSSEAIEKAVHIITREADGGNRVVVVVSAMSGVTNMLLKAVQAAQEGDKWGYREIADDIRFKHEDAINQLIEAGEERDSILKQIHTFIEQLVGLCDAIHTIGEATPRITDAAVSYGERMSSRILASVLRYQGYLAQAFDAGEFITTNDNYQDAEPLWDITQANIEKKLVPKLASGIIPVVTGFLGKTPDGTVTTLGRGGSDFSAAIFAAYTDSDEVTIWTDVNGVMTTDPRIDRRARVLPYVSYTEVGELAFYGAKVLHPKTVQPIINRNIPMRVRNTFNPDYPGTLIGAEMQAADTIIKAVTSIRQVSMMTVSGKGMLGVPGIAGRTFLATARAGANILMISQSSSEQSFCFTVRDENAYNVKEAVEQELANEISYQDVDGVDITSDVVIVTVVGAGMRGTPGVAGRIFTVLGDNDVNIISIAQGGSECSISFVINEHDLDKAVHRLHDLALQAVPEI